MAEGEERGDQYRDRPDADDGVPPTDPTGRRRSLGVAFTLQGIGVAHRLLVRVGAQNLVDIVPALGLEIGERIGCRLHGDTLGAADDPPGRGDPPPAASIATTAARMMAPRMLSPIQSQVIKVIERALLPATNRLH